MERRRHGRKVIEKVPEVANDLATAGAATEPVAEIALKSRAEVHNCSASGARRLRVDATEAPVNGREFASILDDSRDDVVWSALDARNVAPAFRSLRRGAISAKCSFFCVLVLVLLHGPLVAQLSLVPRKRIASGAFDSFVIESNGLVRAWGANNFGQLGVGATSVPVLTPIEPIVPPGVVQITSATAFTYFVMDDGSVFRTGSPGFGTPLILTPALFSGISNVWAMSTGHQGTGLCVALKADGTVWAWGIGTAGQLGNGTFGVSSTPVLVGNGALTNIVAIDVGGSHCLALRDDGTVWAWGLNNFGQLGDGTFANRSLPVQVGGGSLNNVVAISAGTIFSMCLLSDGSLRCWGDNAFAQLGTGSTGSAQNLPVTNATPNDIIAIAAGDYHAYALRSNGALLGWGTALFGAVGNGSTTGLLATPTAQLNLPQIVDISSDSNAGIALAQDGTVWLFGAGSSGQMGVGTALGANPLPVSPMVYLGGAYLRQEGQGLAGSGFGGPFDVLSVNGSVGTILANGFNPRRVDVSVFSPITIGVSQPLSNSLPAPFAIFGIVGAPGPSDVTVLPAAIGTMCFTPSALNPNLAGAFMLTSSYGPDPSALFGSTPAPWVLSVGALPFPFAFTLQGVISDSATTIRTTNGVIVNVQ